jgi:hypothetical protein
VAKIPTVRKIWRQTREELGGRFGLDKRRRLVVGLVAPDMIVMYPKGTRQRVAVELKQVYFDALYREALVKHLERARARKAKLKEVRARRRMAAAERRLRKA